MLPAPGVEPNTVIEVIQKGYELNDRLLRAAKVIVGAGARRHGVELPQRRPILGH